VPGLGGPVRFTSQFWAGGITLAGKSPGLRAMGQSSRTDLLEIVQYPKKNMKKYEIYPTKPGRPTLQKGTFCTSAAGETEEKGS